MITAIVLTKNSARTLSQCLQSLKWCGEVIVIDDYSSDNTVGIAKKYKARVYQRKLAGDFAAQRNFGITKAKGDWVLFLDSDETIGKITIPLDGCAGYRMARSDIWLGREIKHGETEVKLLRLAKKSAGKWQRKVHEYWAIRGKVGELSAKIKHFPHPSVREFIAEINAYSRLHSQQNKKEGKHSSLLKVILFPAGKFIQNFIFKAGWRDGNHGLVIAGIMSFHSFLAWSDLWLTARKQKS